MARKTVFFLVRHGEAEHNVLRVLDPFPGNPSYGLTPRGRRQAGNAGERLAKERIDILFSSPMRRTRETAETISGTVGTGIPLRFDGRLRETDFGIWGGRSLDDFRGKGKKYEYPLRRVRGDAEERLEGFSDIRNRLVDFLRDILPEYGGKGIVIVSHGDTLEQLHGILVGEDVETAAVGWYPKKGEVYRVAVGADIVSRIVSGA
jgi:broad specificity phosphatase PhoE